MGNRASCEERGLPPLPPLTAVPPKVPEKITRSEVTETSLPNPGDFEEIGKKAKEQLSPQAFDGAKIVIQKGLSRHFQTMHTLTLASSTQPSQWQFGATFVGSKKLGDNDFRPVLIGDMSNSGSFTALCLHQFGNLKVKVNLQTQQSRWVGYQGTADYVGQDFTASATLANPNILTGSGVLVAQYLQSVTSRLALGSEMLYQRSSDGMQNAVISLGGYYRAPEWEATAKIGLHSVSLGYHQKFKDYFTLVCDLEGSLMQGESVAGIGYRLELGGMTMKGKVDSHGVVSAVLEKRLDPIPATLMLSGQLNHWTDDSRFGISIMVG
ncbi:mitochondrial import receptor subunit TOM40 homolog [Halichondria panicea]|uniref:mitochondrial import receptor subunit TOM40 homolog n=1 Tax=Halichondria panicea TaxID=6063 RepID=UPI00312B7FC3